MPPAVPDEFRIAPKVFHDRNMTRFTMDKQFCPRTRLFVGVSMLLLANACASRETASASPEPVDVPLLPPRSACVLPVSLDTYEACREFARCCVPVGTDPPTTCSFARSGAVAECVCALRPGYEVRCKDENGITCSCDPSP